MELKTAISGALARVLSAPIFDIRLDLQGNAVGYVADAYFEGKSDVDCQRIIWAALSDNLKKDDLNKVLAIFNETPTERTARLMDERGSAVISELSSGSHIWKHQAIDQSKFWLLLDVVKTENGYRVFYLIVNSDYNIKDGEILNYPKDVIEFMELEQSEVYQELYSNTFSLAESHIKTYIMNKYAELEMKGIHGNDNKYFYVFEKFAIQPARKSEMLFSPKEIELFSSVLANFKDFMVTSELDLAIKNSELFNHYKIDI
jgi:acid stress-induced BolA-like protein IbaG/YrbA